jgi:hypothetical protein
MPGYDTDAEFQENEYWLYVRGRATEIAEDSYAHLNRPSRTAELIRALVAEVRDHDLPVIQA